MKFEVFGKPTCAMCKSTKDKLTHLLGKASASAVGLEFVDVESVTGMAEGAFNDVHDIPTVIVRSDAGSELARWEGKVPPSVEIQAFLGAGQGTATQS